MFNDDEDYGFLTGSLGDLDGDGRVDFVEYMNEEDDFQRIMGSNDDDYSVLDDLEDEYSDEEYSDFNYDINEDDYENEDYEDESDDEEVYLPDGFDISKLSLTIGATTSLNYDGKPIDQVFGVSEENQYNTTPKNTPTKQQSAQSIERKYYDRGERKYRIGDAIYDNFKEISDNYEKHECEEFSTLIDKIYRVDKELAVTIWVWAIYNFPGALVNRGVDEWNSQAWSLTDCIFSDLASIDSESDSEEEQTSIFRYISKNPDLEEIIFNKTYIDNDLYSLTKYIPYCIENNLRENFLHVYNGVINNRFRSEEKMSKYSIIEDLLSFCNIYGVREADPWFYAFFEKEIKSLNKPLKEAYLMKGLNEEEYDIRVFLKPEKENLELDDEYFGKSDTTDEISREEYKKLKNENKALKSKVTQLENRITDLNYNIQRLEKDLAAKRKVKEWDGKYYRYCRVTMDECPNGLWYRTNDITLKKGDYVYVPYGYKNEELMAKVVLVEEFRSDDLPVPLEKMKFIIEKCDA